MKSKYIIIENTAVELVASKEEGARLREKLIQATLQHATLAFTSKDAVMAFKKVGEALELDPDCLQRAGEVLLNMIDGYVDNGCQLVLLSAAFEGHLGLVKYLVGRGVDVNKVDNSGQTALMLASEKGHLGVVEFLVKCGAKVAHVSNVGMTALIYASREGRMGVVKYLVEYGVNVSHATVYGGTALMIASGEGQLDVVEYLARQEVDINQVDLAGLTALMYASHGGHLSVVESLVKHGAKITYATTYGYTALLFATRAGRSEVVRFLLHQGVNLTFEQKSGLNGDARQLLKEVQQSMRDEESVEQIKFQPVLNNHAQYGDTPTDKIQSTANSGFFNDTAKSVTKEMEATMDQGSSSSSDAGGSHENNNNESVDSEDSIEGKLSESHAI